MRTLTPIFLMALGVVILPRVVSAADETQPQRFGPESPSTRLDANRGDPVKAHPPSTPWWQDRSQPTERFQGRSPGHGPPNRSEGQSAAGHPSNRPDRGPGEPTPDPRVRGHMPPHASGSVPPWHGGPTPPQAGRFGPKMPDPAAMFSALDRNKDRVLTLDEFAAGVRHFHSNVARTGQPMRFQGSRPTFNRMGSVSSRARWAMASRWIPAAKRAEIGKKIAEFRKKADAAHKGAEAGDAEARRVEARKAAEAKRTQARRSEGRKPAEAGRARSTQDRGRRPPPKRAEVDK